MEREMKPMVEEPRITHLDIRMGIAVLICVLTATILDSLGIKFQVGELRLEIVQKMTSAISCMLVCQETITISRKSGRNRLIITAIGGLVGILVVLIDGIVGNKWIFAGMIGIGVIVTLLLCKCCKVPYINARIGGVTFILVTCTFASHARVYYAIFRFISTFYGVLVVYVVTWISQMIHQGKYD